MFLGIYFYFSFHPQAWRFLPHLHRYSTSSPPYIQSLSSFHLALACILMISKLWRYHYHEWELDGIEERDFYSSNSTYLNHICHIIYFTPQHNDVLTLYGVMEIDTSVWEYFRRKSLSLRLTLGLVRGMVVPLSLKFDCNPRKPAPRFRKSDSKELNEDLSRIQNIMSTWENITQMAALHPTEFAFRLSSRIHKLWLIWVDILVPRRSTPLSLASETGDCQLASPNIITLTQ